MDDIPEKRCPVCGGRLTLMYEDAYLRFDTPLKWFPDDLSMNVYECESCHRLEFYNSVPAVPKENDGDDKVICPDCGQEHSKYINCPTCFMAGKRKNDSCEAGEKRGKKGRAPWEFKKGCFQ